MQGAERNGVVGFAGGVATGLANGVLKPAAGKKYPFTLFSHVNVRMALITVGACGLVGYSSLGVYKSIRQIKVSGREKKARDVVWGLGEAEYERATDVEKLYVVRVWCQNMMRVRLI